MKIFGNFFLKKMKIFGNFFLKKCQVLDNFLIVKWQFSGGSGGNLVQFAANPGECATHTYPVCRLNHHCSDIPAPLLYCRQGRGRLGSGSCRLNHQVGTRHGWLRSRHRQILFGQGFHNGVPRIQSSEVQNKTSQKRIRSRVKYSSIINNTKRLSW